MLCNHILKGFAMTKGFKETHAGMACFHFMVLKCMRRLELRDRWFIFGWLFYQCFRRKLITYHQSVCWLLSNNSWICAPVSCSFEGFQIPTHWGKKREPIFPLFGLLKGQCAFIDWTTVALCFFLSWQQREDNTVGTWGKLKGALGFVVWKIGELGTDDEEVEDVEGSEVKR